MKYDRRGKLNYIANMRPVFNRRALYSNASYEYLIPAEPMPYSLVTIRFRTKRNNVDHVILHYNDETLFMKKEKHNRSMVFKEFDYYSAQITVDDKEIEYYFEVRVGRITCYYDTRGAIDELHEHFPFRFIPGFKTPEWAKGAVMYQIFVDRFYNGDKFNDVLTDEYAYIGEHSRRVENWDKYPAAMGVREFYGGDLQGVMDKLDYLQDLGIEAIYFNPLFVSPSNHKYDIQDYDYIDPHFGVIFPDTECDADGHLLNNLDAGDNNNRNAMRYRARVTNKRNLEASNNLFANLVQECHRRGIKVIMDGVFNHCGSFNKWLDRERIYEGTEGYEPGAYIEKDSPYHSFFLFHDENAFPYNETYDGWWGHDTLPKLNYEQSLKLQDYILNIARKWLSPPYSIDGWRLDVAADLGFSPEFNHTFWKKFRQAVKETNPEAIIIAEHYGNPREWLRGDEWDTVMNYDAFMEPLTWYLTGMQKHSDDFRHDLLNNTDNMYNTIKYHASFFTMPSLMVSMNELSNHDHSRFLTRTNRKVGRMNTLGSEAANQGVNKAVMRNAVMFQFTWVGCPTIYYADEAGQCGFTDPDNRRTYPWGNEDHELIDYHRELIRLRKMCPELKKGATKYIDGGYGYLCFARFNSTSQSIIVINNSDKEVELSLPVWLAEVPWDGVMTRLICSTPEGHDAWPETYNIGAGHLKIKLSPTSCALYRFEGEQTVHYD